jgi:hypothetical protein
LQKRRKKKQTKQFFLCRTLNMVATMTGHTPHTTAYTGINILILSQKLELNPAHLRNLFGKPRAREIAQRVHNRVIQQLGNLATEHEQKTTHTARVAIHVFAAIANLT